MLGLKFDQITAILVLKSSKNQKKNIKNLKKLCHSSKKTVLGHLTKICSTSGSSSFAMAKTKKGQTFQLFDLMRKNLFYQEYKVTKKKTIYLLP